LATAALMPFGERLKQERLGPLTAEAVETLQVNLGRLCNLSCGHCHVSAGPGHTELMGPKVMDACIGVLDSSGKSGPSTLDITGGAPEMNTEYRGFVSKAVSKDVKVKTRTNLTILTEPGFEEMPKFWAGLGVEVIASLPCYTAENVDLQRGPGVFERSLSALKALNGVGYGKDDALRLNLVYNPGGAFLPGDQLKLEADYKKWLSKEHGVVFNSLFTITNMPIGRFKERLEASGELDAYMRLLSGAFNRTAIDSLMCRKILSVGFDGTLYDCDFNQQAGLGLSAGAPLKISSFEMKLLGQRRIATGMHCYGCTAGAGSSCTGSLTKALKDKAAA
jgi:radical SAM/Cys-rich protein